MPGDKLTDAEKADINYRYFDLRQSQNAIPYPKGSVNRTIKEFRDRLASVCHQNNVMASRIPGFLPDKFRRSTNEAIVSRKLIASEQEVKKLKKALATTEQQLSEYKAQSEKLKRLSARLMHDLDLSRAVSEDDNAFPQSIMQSEQSQSIPDDDILYHDLVTGKSWYKTKPWD
jgi:hypothetical protein